MSKGYEVVLGDSPWRLTTADRLLIEPLVAGIADGRRGRQETWRRAIFKRGGTPAVPPSAGFIGHTDLLAIPPR